MIKCDFFIYFLQSNILGGSLQDLLTPPQRLIKAKSESSVASLCSATTIMSTGHDHDGKLTKVKFLAFPDAQRQCHLLNWRKMGLIIAHVILAIN